MAPQTLTPDTLESRSRRLDNRIRNRNRFEYLAGGIVIIASLLLGGWLLLGGPVGQPDLMVGGGFVALALGALVSMIQLRRKTGGTTLPDGAQSSVNSYRAELVRQRDALRSVFGWYIAPFLPGFLLIYGASLLDPSAILWAVLLPAAITVAFLVWVVWANRRAAACIDQEIVALDRETTG
ncbi:MAG: hypothetical protein RLP98_10035 [Devosia sp.]